MKTPKSSKCTGTASNRLTTYTIPHNVIAHALSGFLYARLPIAQHLRYPRPKGVVITDTLQKRYYF